MKTYLVSALLLLTVTAWGQAQTSAPKTSVKATTPNTSTLTNASLTDPPAGEIVYKQYCLSCHQASGSGVPKLNPPLKGTSWVVGDKTRLINVILNGLQNVDIDDEVYDNVMPAHDFLTDRQIADVLTYVRSHFGNQASAVAPDEVKNTRSAAGK